MFFLKKIFQKKLNINEVEDILFENGEAIKRADMLYFKEIENTLGVGSLKLK